MIHRLRSAPATGRADPPVTSHLRPSGIAGATLLLLVFVLATPLPGSSAATSTSADPTASASATAAPAVLLAHAVIETTTPHPDDIIRAQIWVAATGQPVAVDRLIAADPYFGTPGVTVEKIRQWEPFLS
jgi:hypothetical protein